MQSAHRRVLLIRNPTAGQFHQTFFRKVLHELERLGCTVTMRETLAPRHAEELAADVEGFDVVVAAGGDGTINEVLQGLPEGSPPLAVIPMGTANVLALEIGLTKDAVRVARAIAQGEGRDVYTGMVNNRRFILMTGVGFDAWVVGNVSTPFKRFLGRFGLGKMAYVWTTLIGLFRFPFSHYQVSMNGDVIQAASVIVTKAHFYGGSFQCAPDVRLTTPEFHVCLAERRGAWNTLRYAVALSMNRFHRLPDVQIVPATNLRIDGPEGEAAQGDGDSIATLPLDISLSPKPVRLIYPD